MSVTGCRLVIGYSECTSMLSMFWMVEDQKLAIARQNREEIHDNSPNFP
jgi:hypothetical protein